jgi:hypothetical protein
MLKKYYSRTAVKDGEAKKDGGDGDAGGFPAVENVFLIFGGPTVDMSNSQRKQERHEVLPAEKAPPFFLDWSEDTITFSHEDHPNRIPNLGQYPLVVDPVIGCRMDLPGPTTSVGTRTDYSVGPWDYPACATWHLMAWSTRTTQK